MYINAFLAGVLFTLFAETVIITVAAVVSIGKIMKNGGKK